MRRKLWLKKEQIKYIRENVNSKSNQELADYLNIDKQALSRAMIKYKIKRDHEFQKKLMSHKGEDNPGWKGGIKKDNYHYTKLQRERYPEKVKARQILKRAIERGDIIKPTKCDDCPADFPDSPDKIHGHHEDYTKPLDVDWVCRACHRKKHGGTH